MRILYVTRHLNHSGYEVLNRLIKDDFEIVGVLLKNDKSWLLRPWLRYIPIIWYEIKCYFYRCEPLKTIRSEELLAKNNKLPIIKTDSIKSDQFYNELTRIRPDIIVLGGGWHELLPERVFSFPEYGCINTHPSLLPEFRGTSITRWQILYGVKESGSTIHYVDGKFDTGLALAQKRISINTDETPQGLFLKLGKLGAEQMPEVLREIKQGDIKQVQNENVNQDYVSYFSRWQWDDNSLKINWAMNFQEIHYHIKANTQESYQYTGPTFKIGGDTYFMRSSTLIPLNSFIELNKIPVEYYQSSKVLLVRSGRDVYFYRNGENFLLELNSIQKSDLIRIIRRSFKPGERFYRKYQLSNIS